MKAALESLLGEAIRTGEFTQAIKLCTEELLLNHNTAEDRVELIFALALTQHFQLQAFMAGQVEVGKQLAQTLGITDEEKARVTLLVTQYFQQLAGKVNKDG